LSEANEQPDELRQTRAGEALLARALGRARLALFWENLWPALASIATAVGLFLALSWFGLWVSLPPLARAVGLFAFFVLAVAATVPLFKVRWPDAISGLRRLYRGVDGVIAAVRRAVGWPGLRIGLGPVRFCAQAAARAS